MVAASTKILIDPLVKKIRYEIKFSNFKLIIIIVFFIVSFVISFSLDQKEKQTDYAILFSNQIDVWSEPNQLGELLFSLHEGTKFQILDDLAEWQKIRIANGSEGWVKNAYLRKLN